MYLSLERVKKHLNIDDDFREDDEYLMSLVAVAEQAIEIHIGRKFECLVDCNGVLPAPLLQAQLLLIGTLYLNRESVGNANIKALPHAYDYLLDLFQNYHCYC